MELNKVHNLDFLNNTLPEKSVQLIIADPPYFEVKGDFDFVWNSFEDYLKDVEKWAIECKRLLADNGTLFWYGMDRKIAYAQIIFDKHFELLGTLVWEKPSIANEWDTRRTFPERGQERILMYSNEINRTGLEEIKLDINNFKPLRQYFKELQEFIGLGLKKINETLGHRKAEHGFYHSSTQWDLPIIETYNELIHHFKIDRWEGFKEYETLRQEYEYLRKEYEDLRKEYEDKRRPFNNYLGLTDVLKFSRVHNAMHPTQKPEDLTRSLILTCSRPNDLVLAPFAGSGTECAMAVKEKRRCIGFEIEPKYTNIANQRIQKELSTPTLF